MSFCDRYELGERLAVGGMGSVHRGFRLGAEGFRRPVAIKFIHEHLSADADYERMFTREAKLASILYHPNIVQVLDFDRDESGRLFLVMEMVEGASLKELERRVKADGTSAAPRLPLSLSAYIVGEVLAALEHAHAADVDGQRVQIVHRDVSPDNILVALDGTVKLTDFGIARGSHATCLTQSGVIKGKCAYMSPEQVRCLALDGRSDLFSLGVVLWELLTGERLFRYAFETHSVVYEAVLNEEIFGPSELRPDVSNALSDVCLKLLERDRSHRFPSARAALEALSACDEYRAGSRRKLAEWVRDERSVSQAGPGALQTTLTSSDFDTADVVELDTAVHPLPIPVRRRPVPWRMLGALALLSFAVVVSFAIALKNEIRSKSVAQTSQAIHTATSAPARVVEAVFVPPIEPKRAAVKKRRARSKVRISHLDVAGLLDRAAVESAFARIKPALARCFETVAAPKSVALWIEPGGRVTRVMLHPAGAASSRCPRAVAQKIRFPQVPNHGPKTPAFTLVTAYVEKS